MDSRIEILAEELQSLPQGRNFEPLLYVHRIKALHGELTLEADKVVLLALRKAFLDLCERQILSQNGNIEQFANARRAEDKLLCIEEASPRGELDPARLLHIVKRETLAGRLNDPDFLEFAIAGSSVLGDNVSHSEVKTSWLSRWFAKKQ
ncbi:MAG: hypothetical protein ABL918_13110 [Chakrabartia sp.]